MQIPTFRLENGEVEVLSTVIGAWCDANQMDAESECARAIIATALEPDGGRLQELVDPSAVLDLARLGNATERRAENTGCAAAQRGKKDRAIHESSKL